MAEQPISKRNLIKKLFISGFLIASGGLLINWIAWVTSHVNQQIEAQDLEAVQTRVEPLDGIEERLNNLEAVQQQISANGIREIIVEVKPSPTETGASSLLASAFDNYHIWSLQHRKAALQAQLVKDNILFFTTLIIVGFGLYLSYLQFKKSDQVEGTLKLGPTGIEITSSILGIFILAFSVGFFYLYLIHVFPVEEMGQDNLPPVAAPSTQGEE